ncbi:MAG: acetylglutamate kinase [Candidatus Ancillula sp.]|jgi:acetylglutamate kinase|nr:acetylglutamate kinase [Candidatus Ancillula sp.]
MTETRLETKTAALVEALPWIQSFSGSVVVVKYGGNAMVSDELRDSFARDILFMHSVGLKPVVVHGGGPQISSMLKKLGIETEFLGGFRVTTPEAMDVVRMVLTGKISRELVGMINSNSPKKKGLAIGMSGEDGGLFKATRKLTRDDNDNTVELGLVGDIVSVDPSAVLDLLDQNRIPVISTVAPNVSDPQEVLNVNADVAAGKLAQALDAKKLVILTDVEGLYSDYPDKDSLISQIGTDDLYSMLPRLQSGMIPKMSACLDAVSDNVAAAHVIDGRKQHSLLEEIFTTSGIGTIVLRGSRLKYADETRNVKEGLD